MRKQQKITFKKNIIDDICNSLSFASLFFSNAIANAHTHSRGWTQFDDFLMWRQFAHKKKQQSIL